MDKPKNFQQQPKPQAKDEPKRDGSAPMKRMSYYGTQLAEKQKAKEMYGMREKQFRKFYGIAHKAKGDTGANLIELLERRLDNVLFRSGLAATRRMARQMIVHRHVNLNGVTSKSPSILVKEGDEVTFRIDKMPKVIVDMEFTKGKITVPAWLEKSKDTAKIKTLPLRKDLDVPIKENLIVELYSK
jgi:small subunit ribosomal protein S4